MKTPKQQRDRNGTSRSDRDRVRPREDDFNFRYEKRSVKDVREQIERRGSYRDSPSKGTFLVWRPKPGDNLIRILPPTWKNWQHYSYPVMMHRWVGADPANYLCPRLMGQAKSCPICKAEQQAREDREEEVAKKLRAQEHWICWIIDREAPNERKNRPQLFVMSNTMDKDVVGLTRDRRTDTVLYVDDPEAGYDLSFHREGTTLNTKYSSYAFDRESSPISNSRQQRNEILKYISEHPVPSTLQYYDYEHIQNALYGTTEEVDEELDTDTTAATADDEEEDQAATGTGDDEEEQGDDEQEDATDDEETETDDEESDNDKDEEESDEQEDEQEDEQVSESEDEPDVSTQRRRPMREQPRVQTRGDNGGRRDDRAKPRGGGGGIVLKKKDRNQRTYRD